MSQMLYERPTLSLQLWRYLEMELMRGNAFLLPLRLFIGLGWMRAGMEKLIDPSWTSGTKLTLFLQGQIDANAVYFPFYETLITQLFVPNALSLSWIILIGQLLAGVAILFGTFTNAALLGGLFMNLNFVLAGAVNPSAFYIIIQSALLASNSGATLGGDAFLSRYIPSFWLVAQSNFEGRHRTLERWSLLLLGVCCCLAAALIVPYIRDFGPHSIEDPAMLMFILFMLGGMLLGIIFVRTGIGQFRLASAIEQRQLISESVLRSPQKRLRKLIYPGLLTVLYLSWFSYMMWSDSWHLFQTYWPVSLTMTLGSFVAGATAEGGAAIAFPVFTKVLHIASTDARTFGLMIQAVGMTMAGAVILAKGVKILPKVILWATAGGAIGQVVGAYWLYLPNPYPKILFTFTAAVFGFALIVSRWGLQWEPRATLFRWSGAERSIFFFIGIVGGAFAAITGSGIDMLTFIVLTLAFGINEKISTPTTVIIMALNSIVGFALHGLVLQDIGVAWNYWLVAVPIVVIGAPLGAVAASRLKRDHIILFLLSLITIELVTTIWLVPFSPTAMRVTAAAVFVCSLGFAAMLIYRQRVVGGHSVVPNYVWPGSSSDEQLRSSRALPDRRASLVSCEHCHQHQDVANGDCRWCGTSLAMARPVVETAYVPSAQLRKGGHHA